MDKRKKVLLFVLVLAIIIVIMIGFYADHNNSKLVAEISPGGGYPYVSVKVTPLKNQTFSEGRQKEIKLWANNIFFEQQFVSVHGSIPKGVFLIYAPDGEIIKDGESCIITAKIIGIYRPKNILQRTTSLFFKKTL